MVKKILVEHVIVQKVHYLELESHVGSTMWF